MSEPVGTASSTRTRRLIILAVVVLALAAGGTFWLASLNDDSKPASSAANDTTTTSTSNAQFAGLRSYVDEHTDSLVEHTTELDAAAATYLELFEAADGDYERLATDDPTAVRAALEQARTAWLAANPAYEEMEGVVAGVPSLAKYDVSIDAGAPGSDGPDGAVEFDVKVNDERTLTKPGNFFLLTEATLWGTEPEWSSEVAFDVDGDGTDSGFGDLLPDAEVLRAVARDFVTEAKTLRTDADAWIPTEGDAFTALVTMTPTMGEYFNAWKQSRFVAGDKATERGFVASSRLDDVVGILSGLGVVRASLDERMVATDPAAAKAAKDNLAALTAFVDDLRTQEAAGTKFTAQDADRHGADAQEQAEQIAATITDLGREAGVKIDA
ncbi:MAG: hypothetical protein JWM90_718 [Thermoleophilia bacterium]|nr:hypothetical protein [Thermoleophilia bacterium]